MKKQFWTEVTLATFFVFVLMGGIYQFTQLNVFNAFDSIGRALGDVDLTDYVFWGLRDSPRPDEKIVVANIGNLSRREIAEQIRIISKYKPKVIGIDSFFPDAKSDTLGDLLLREAIREAGNVVLVSKVDQTKILAEKNVDTYDSLGRSHAMFTEVAFAEGFANLDTEAAFQHDVKTCRSFPPQVMVNNDNHQAFSVVLASVYDPEKAKVFLERDNYWELIDYRGNVVDMFGQSGEDYRNMFYALDTDQVLNEEFEGSIIEDKIVLFGYLGAYFGDPSWEDRFYTPLSTKLAGKANPDMFGVVIHANIVSMILNQLYLDTMAEWQTYLMAFVLCFLNMALFWLIYHYMPDWYDGITKLLQVIQLLALTILMVYIFHWFEFKLDITITLAAIALAGDTYEVFEGVIVRGYQKTKSILGFSKTPDEIVSSQS